VSRFIMWSQVYSQSIPNVDKPRPRDPWNIAYNGVCSTVGIFRILLTFHSNSRQGPVEHGVIIPGFSVTFYRSYVSSLVSFLF